MKKLFALLALVGTFFSAHADAGFPVKNDDGVTIFYQLVSSSECKVSYHPRDYESGRYSGIINIPSTVPFRDKTLTVTSIDNEAFRETNVTSVTLPETLTSIRENAFLECPKLTSIVIPASVTSIEHEAFKDCPRLSSVTILSTNLKMGYRVFKNCTNLTTVTLSEGLVSIGNDVFKGCI